MATLVTLLSAPLASFAEGALLGATVFLASKGIEVK